jgi:hypothetical protein
MTQFDQAENDDINTRNFRPCPDGDGLFCPNIINEVNGPDSAEVLSFVPTRYELIQLVKHWATIIKGYRFDEFVYQQESLSGNRRACFAVRRIDRIATVLGEEAVEKAINEVEEEFIKTVSPRAWLIFKNGIEEERSRIQEALHYPPNDPCDEASDMDSEGEEQKDVDGPIIGTAFSTSTSSGKAISLGSGGFCLARTATWGRPCA